jgi:hypothetical protein
MVDKTCPNCLSLVPAFNDHCYACGYDFPDVAPDETHDGAPSRDTDRPEPMDGTLAASAGMNLLVGLLVTVMGLGHLQGVIVTATMGRYDSYDFRLAALLIVGIALVFGGALCLSAVRGLARRQRTAWGRAVIGTILLLLVLVPLFPIQPDMAPGLSVLAAVNLILLLAAWRGLGTFTPSAFDSEPQPVPIGVWDPELRICPWCGKKVAADRKSRCNHCGELLATRSSQPQESRS